MKRFDNTELWEILKNSPGFPSGLSEGLEVALDSFIMELYKYCRDEKSMAERIRSLVYARNELSAYTECSAYGSKKYAHFRYILMRAIRTIDSELHILEKRFRVSRPFS